MEDETCSPETHRRLLTGDVATALQVATEHAHEAGWEAVRLSRPNMRPWTAVRLGKAADIAVFSKVTAAGRLSYRSVQLDRLILIRKGGSPRGRRMSSIVTVHAYPAPPKGRKVLVHVTEGRRAAGQFEVTAEGWDRLRRCIASGSGVRTREHPL